MMTQEENERLTRVGPGTPAGELLRRYWQPVAICEELPPGGAPMPVKILGEDLVLFRDDQGRPGLLGIHCAHRGANLSYGRVEDGGLRCIYHGWLYDIQGRCLDQPGEPDGGAHRDSIRHTAYACQEAAGVIFTFMGPGKAPLLPAYEALLAPDGHRFSPTKCLHECNYLQANEGNIDPVHLSFLHRIDHAGGPVRYVPGSDVPHYTLLANDMHPTIAVEPTDFGLRIYTVRNSGAEQNYVRITNFIMPNLCAIGGLTGQDGYQMDWHVPIDDTHHWKYTVVFKRSAPLGERVRARRDLDADYRLTRNPANRYLQDRKEMQSRSFSGLGSNFLVHDAFAVQSAGPIQDRTMERLTDNDKAIVMARLLLLNAIREVREGRDPLHVVRNPDANHFSHLVVKDEVIAKSRDWRNYWKDL